MDHSTVFVFYKKRRESAQWKYPRLGTSAPKWTWVGGGFTGNARFPREEQLQGPGVAKERAEVYLRRKFALLVRRGLVTRFAIAESYSGLNSL